MADHRFTIRDQLKSVGVELNIPPFLGGKKQLPPTEVQQGRSIVSLRIHVERAIGHMKNLTILSGIFPLQMAWIINQIVSVCACLTNFFPLLYHLPQTKNLDLMNHHHKLIAKQRHVVTELFMCSVYVVNIDIKNFACARNARNVLLSLS